MIAGIYMHFMEVAFYSVIKISYICVTMYQNIISLFGHIKITNGTKLDMFSLGLNKIEVFFILEYELHILHILLQHTEKPDVSNMMFFFLNTAIDLACK